MVALLSNGVPVSKASGFIEGQGSLEVRVPVLADGVYELAVEGPGFSASQELQVESRTVPCSSRPTSLCTSPARQSTSAPSCSILS